MGAIGDMFGGGSGDDAADSAKYGAKLQADAQKEALEYLKSREELPQQYRESALTNLAGIAGMEGGEGSQQELINRAMKSPLYSAMMGGKKEGEDSIMRNAAATGGLRSGNTSAALYDYNTQLKNNALLQSYNQEMAGIQGLAGLPSNANNIAGMTADIGKTLGQGEIGAAQSQMQGSQNSMGNMMGAANLGMQAFSMFSDIRLKDNIRLIGERNGHNWYSWTWNDLAKKLNLSGDSMGVMAHEISESVPESIGEKDGFITVNYAMIGVK